MLILPELDGEPILDLTAPLYHEFYLEFISSFQSDPYQPCDGTHADLFYLNNKHFNFSVNALNALLDFEFNMSLRSEEYASTICDVSDELSHVISQQWLSLFVETSYRPRLSQSANIQDPALQLYHRFLSYNLFGRIDSMNIVMMRDIYIR